ncbi:MAG: putative manganese-dependent inorganic diphosphatase [Thermotogaceae bacterium]|nr:putative manganese-dependent inorganic diphosphatase [Thermotogaceae bacterium]
MRKDRIFVIGHKKPDTDSVASAIAYSYLKSTIDRSNEYVPSITDDVNPETDFVLSYFGVEKPQKVTHVYTTVEDAMTKRVLTAHVRSTIYEVGNLMLDSGIRTIPLADDKRFFYGLVTEREIARRFLREFNRISFDECPIKVEKLTKLLNADILSKGSDEYIKGLPLIATFSAKDPGKYSCNNKILIIGDREDILIRCIENGVKYVIVTDGVKISDGVKRLASERNVTMLRTEFSSFDVVRFLRLSFPGVTIAKKNPLAVSSSVLLKDFAEDLMESDDGVAVVLDNEGRIEGIITRHDLINPGKKKVIIVDHSEKSQAVEGIEEAEIVEIIDHHRLGGLETAHPIKVLIRPVGATSTIIYSQYESYGVKLHREIAGLLLSAIISDTLILRSPTTTREDRRVVEKLASIAGVDPMEFGIEMFRKKLDVSNITVREVLTMDMKEFRTSKGLFAVSQVEAVEPNIIISQKDMYMKEMKNILEEKRYLFYLFMVTDVMKESSYIIGVGNLKTVEKALRKSFDNGVIYLQGVVSRKKQLIPVILNML